MFKSSTASAPQGYFFTSFRASPSFIKEDNGYVITIISSTFWGFFLEWFDGSLRVCLCVLIIHRQMLPMLHDYRILYGYYAMSLWRERYFWFLWFWYVPLRQITANYFEQIFWSPLALIIQWFALLLGHCSWLNNRNIHQEEKIIVPILPNFLEK